MTSLGLLAPGATLKRAAVPSLIALAPALLILLTWGSESGQIGSFGWMLKCLALPIVGAELLIIGIATRERLRSGTGVAFPSEPVMASAAALLAIAIITAATVAPHPQTASVWTTLWVIHVLFGWAIFTLCSRFENARRDVIDAHLAGFMLAAVLLLIYISRIDDPATFDWMNGVAGFDNIRRVAYYAAPIFGLCLGRFSSATSRVGWLSTLAVASTAAAFIFWNGARGAIMAIALAYGLGAMLFPALRRFPVAAGVTVSAMLGGFAASVMSSPADFMGMGRLAGATFGDAVSPMGATSGRWELWHATLEAIASRPLFGHGEGQLAFVVPLAEAFKVSHPHNLLLQLLLAWGVVGTLLLLVIAVPVAARAFVNVRDRGGEFLPPFMAMTVLLFYSGVDGTLYHVQAASLFAAFAGAAMPRPAVAADDRKKAETSNVRQKKRFRLALLQRW